ncbi:MAG: hypothetical protein QM656_03715 [Paracoccaceae bacterium]
MKRTSNPMIEQPVEENLRRVYGGAQTAMDLPPQLAGLLAKLAARQDAKGKELPPSDATDFSRQ